jgi:large subunit ribosomal protein L3
VTVIEAGPCTVLQKKTVGNEGYNAIQVGFLEKKASRVNKPDAGHFKRSGHPVFIMSPSSGSTDPEAYELGQQVTVKELLNIGDNVDVSGKSKGRDFRCRQAHGFAGGRATHGSMFHRAPGSIGCSAWPSRVVKGKKMPGRMGNTLVTQKNLKVVDIREDEHILLVKGAVPGAKNGLIKIFTKG